MKTMPELQKAARVRVSLTLDPDVHAFARSCIDTSPPRTMDEFVDLTIRLFATHVDSLIRKGFCATDFVPYTRGEAKSQVASNKLLRQYCNTRK